MKRLLLSCSLLGLTLANAQVETIEENFSSFEIGKSVAQNGWNSTTNQSIGIRGNSNNTYIQTYSMMEPSVTEYIITPELKNIDGVKKLSFEFRAYGMGGATIQVGVAHTNDANIIATNFQAVSNAITGEANMTPYTVEVPQSNAKYLVFKIVSNNAHTATWLDNVIYKGQTYSVNELNTPTAPKFAIDNNSLIFGEDRVSSVKIFSANGSLVATEKVTQKKVNIGKLSTGVYYILIEGHNGSITKAKFIKK